MLSGSEVQSFVRATALCGTFGPLLTGVGSVTTTSTPPSTGTLALVVAVGLAFHVFAYVLNDVVDLPIDRTEPRRATSPSSRVGSAGGQPSPSHLPASPSGSGSRSFSGLRDRSPRWEPPTRRWPSMTCGASGAPLLC